ncbi:aspartic proteinase NANA, chloroplast-like [Olea europaea var. sylvestris]|uniref:aspartic proteinase NANA, chloroplast-like n=1 Tax=Olea europaea var. sylvestris TaxID=158386 RepID=UPI000C1D8733|nr:aspartic proteinase NANA, chloroplast-like [Olea europaea var. sylvestris]
MTDFPVKSLAPPYISVHSLLLSSYFLAFSSFVTSCIKNHWLNLDSIQSLFAYHLKFLSMMLVMPFSLLLIVVDQNCVDYLYTCDCFGCPYEEIVGTNTLKTFLDLPFTMVVKTRYLSGQPTHGIFANETITFAQTNGEEAKIHNILVGCSSPSDFEKFQGVDGLMGLGYNNYSLTLKAANKFGGKFSYCLVNRFSTQNVSSYLIFGSHESIESIKTHDRMQQTELVLGISSYYGVNIKGISVGKKMLKFPDEVWDVKSGGGMILDSGTTATLLTEHAYEPVMAALTPSLKNFARSNLTIGQFDFCFDAKGYNESLVPRLVFHFADGAQFEPPVENYVLDVGDGVRCLGFVQIPWPDQSIIGNIMQQNHLWEFDLANSRLSFGSSSCT